MADVALRKAGGDPETVLVQSRSGPEMVTETPGWRQIRYLPVGIFGSVMGLTGLSFAWRIAHVRFGAPAWIAPGIGYVAMVAFLAVGAGTWFETRYGAAGGA